MAQKVFWQHFTLLPTGFSKSLVKRYSTWQLTAHRNKSFFWRKTPAQRSTFPLNFFLYKWAVFCRILFFSIISLNTTRLNSLLKLAFVFLLFLPFDTKLCGLFAGETHLIAATSVFFVIKQWTILFSSSLISQRGTAVIAAYYHLEHWRKYNMEGRGRWGSSWRQVPQPGDSARLSRIMAPCPAVAVGCTGSRPVSDAGSINERAEPEASARWRWWWWRGGGSFRHCLGAKLCAGSQCWRGSVWPVRLGRVIHTAVRCCECLCASPSS